MLNTLLYCHACGGEIELIDKVKRADTCEHCGVDLHCCKNCKFFDPMAHNMCRESTAHYEPQKEKANFCTDFVPREGKNEVADKSAALSKLDALFKKK
jgi:hypothetical protein